VLEYLEELAEAQRDMRSELKPECLRQPASVTPTAWRTKPLHSFRMRQVKAFRMK
jgi:hypothetical protein